MNNEKFTGKIGIDPFFNNITITRSELCDNSFWKKPMEYSIQPNGASHSCPGKTILLEVPYGERLLIPVSLLAYMSELKLVEKDIASGGYRFLDREVNLKLVDIDRIKPAKPDPDVVRDNLAASKAKLEQEMASLQKEIDALV